MRFVVTDPDFDRSLAFYVTKYKNVLKLKYIYNNNKIKRKEVEDDVKVLKIK